MPPGHSVVEANDMQCEVRQEAGYNDDSINVGIAGVCWKCYFVRASRDSGGEVQGPMSKTSLFRSRKVLAG